MKRKRSSSPGKRLGNEFASRSRTPTVSPKKPVAVSAPVLPGEKVVTSETPPTTSEKQGAKFQMENSCPDLLDSVITVLTVPGVVALAVAVFASSLAFAPDFDDVYAQLPIHACALVLGMGRGGVPGAATVGGSMFLLLAREGYANQMLAVMTVAQSLPNKLVGFAYRRFADWRFALKLNLFCALGLCLGQYAVRLMSDELIKKFAGFVLLLTAASAEVVGEKEQGSVVDEAKGTSKPTTKNKNGSGSTQQHGGKNHHYVDLLRSSAVMLPFGIFGGVLSYTAGNMGPLLNVYMVFLEMPKYELVATRAAIFIPNDVMKLCQRYADGHLTFQEDSLYLGLRLGAVGVVGVLVAKIWLQRASKELFAFVHDRVTFVMTLVSGALLLTGMSLSEIAASLARSVVLG
eukprot:g1170.t1